MDPLPIGPSQSYDEHPMMWCGTVLCEPLIGRHQQPLFSLRHIPERIILHPLLWGATNVSDVMAHHMEGLDSHERNMFINEDFHTLSGKTSRGVTCSSASDAA